MEKTQREYYLNEQLKAIQKELGEGEEQRDELGELEDRIKKTKLSKEANDKAMAEMKKLRQMSPMSAEATVVRNYLDWMLSLPWGKKSRVKKDIDEAEKVLDDDHYGLEKVKERILEYLAVQQRAGQAARSDPLPRRPAGRRQDLARQVDRARDGPRVRAHVARRRARRSRNPRPPPHLYRLDARQGHSGHEEGEDRQSAVLARRDRQARRRLARRSVVGACSKCLDPEQNATFNDHYLEVDFDLSDVMFITTANRLRMPQPLMDRMEIIRIPGYTEDEKVEIAKRHLLPKQIEAHALKEGEWSITDAALRDLIRYYTREAGVRNLERELAGLARKAVREIVSKKAKTVAVTPKNLDKYAGVRKFRFGEMEGEDQVGVVTGLAWTEVGGDTLTIEAVMLPGKGRMQTTGKLGDVMKESIDAARSYVRSRVAVASASRRRSSTSATSTSTCRKAQRPRTVRRPASR